MQSVFLLMACTSDVVICCRLTLFQKHIVLKTIHRCLKPTPVIMTLAQSTASYAMIESADVGVNFCPHESNGPCPTYETDTRISAFIASDITVSSFKDVTLMLTTHGSGILLRCKRILTWMIYKSAVMVWPFMWHRLSAGHHIFPLMSFDWVLVVVVVVWPIFPPFVPLIHPTLKTVPDDESASFIYQIVSRACMCV